MTGYIYDPVKHTVEFKGEIVCFYCGPEMTDEAIHILDIYFRRISPQDALVDSILKRHFRKKVKND